MQENFRAAAISAWSSLEPVTTTEDKQLLHDLITKHFMYTGSRKAKAGPRCVESMLPKFVKIMPVDYKRVLAEGRRRPQGASNGSVTRTVTSGD